MDMALRVMYMYYAHFPFLGAAFYPWGSVFLPKRTLQIVSLLSARVGMLTCSNTFQRVVAFQPPSFEAVVHKPRRHPNVPPQLGLNLSGRHIFISPCFIHHPAVSSLITFSGLA